MSHRYDFEIDLDNRKTVYSRIIRSVRPGSRVLDVGCDTGNLGAYLKDKGCAVDGIEMDEAAAGVASAKLDNVFVGTVEDGGLTGELRPGYDYIIFADVLEHLADPESVLKTVRPLLGGTGCVLASIPNVANFRVRFGILSGRFDYTETGILDRTHLRFYTFRTARELFERSGYEVASQVPAATHIPTALLWLWPGLFATRSVINARPAS